MQVSNGTGQGSEYRVGSNSGGSTLPNRIAQKSNEPMEYIGVLKPGESASCSADEGVYVEFRIDDRIVASAWFLKDPGQVMLVERGGVFSIAVLDEKSVAA